MKLADESFWSNKWSAKETGWDIGAPSSPIKAYIDQLNNNETRILIPGAGNAYEAEYLFAKGFQHVFVLDIAKEPLEAFKLRNPSFPGNQLMHGDFFDHNGQYDIILEQTFFCSFEPREAFRKAYAKKAAELLRPGGKLVGLWFKHTLDPAGQRPFGGSKEEYETYLLPYFEIVCFEDCFNSITPRSGNELFGIFRKK